MVKRYDFGKHTLETSGADKDPFRQFLKWYGQECKIEGEDASAMSLATVSVQGKPSLRTVFLRGADKKGFCFYTNYNSRKGRELSANRNACLLFFWKETQRQVIIEGRVEKLPPEKSDAYFASRPRGNQLGAWSSQQSQVIPDRKVLEEWVKEFTRLFQGKKIPRPAHWGGYRLVPSAFEFWQGRESRLHDRIVYKRQKKGWKMERLSP